MILQIANLMKKKRLNHFFLVERKKSSKCSVQLLLLWHFVHVHVTNSTLRERENVAFMSVYGIFTLEDRDGGIWKLLTVNLLTSITKITVHFNRTFVANFTTKLSSKTGRKLTKDGQ